MILFRTPGPLDLHAVSTFGLTSKDESQIGRFGTGLKYATAIVLRLGGSITIYQPFGERLEFGIEPGIFRNKPVAFATMNGQRLPFTTELGRDWKPWMAFREFYANTLDEGGVFYRVNSPEQLPAPCPSHTDILIECAEFDAVHDNFEEHFIDPDEKPIAVCPGLEIYAGASRQVFYRGFAVMHTQDTTAFRYNITGALALTEDRTAESAWAVLRRIECGLLECNDETILTTALGQESDFEQALDFPTHTNCSATFLGVTEKLGDNCSPTALLAAAHTRHRRAKTSGDIYESADAPNSNGLFSALAHLRIIGAKLEGYKFAYLAIPSGAPFETNGFDKKIIINEKYRGDAEATLEHLLAAYLQCEPSFAKKRLLRLAKELGKNLEIPRAAE